MSLNSLTNEELVRREAPEEGVREFGAPAPTAESNPVSNALSALSKYIPTEVITLYVALVGVTAALPEGQTFITQRTLYWVFGAATPLLLLLLFWSKLATDGKEIPFAPLRWPWWKMIASFAAFMIWALAVPGSPYVTAESGAVLAGFGAVVVSFFLSVLEPIIQRILPVPG